MPLQKLMIQRVEDTCGLTKILEALKVVSASATVNERFYINNLIIYYRTVFNIKVDILQDVLDYNEQCVATLAILNKKLKTHYSKELEIVRDILQYNINYAIDVKKIG